MRKFYALGICLFLLSPVVVWSQEKQPQQGTQPAQATSTPTQAAPHEFVITPEENARKNPVPFTEESVAKGKKLFATQCVMCHGKTGNGKGELAAVMKVSPPDFTNPETLAKRTDGALFTIINTGSASMPGEAKRLKTNQTWQIVNFLRTLQGKKPAKSAGAKTGSAAP
jgi:mono/diheme cytochrome c family protein